MTWGIAGADGRIKRLKQARIYFGPWSVSSWCPLKSRRTSLALPGQGRPQLQTTAVVCFHIHCVCLLLVSALISQPSGFTKPFMSPSRPQSSRRAQESGSWGYSLLSARDWQRFLQGLGRNRGPAPCHCFAICIMHITAPASAGNERGVTN